MGHSGGVFAVICSWRAIVLPSGKALSGRGAGCGSCGQPASLTACLDDFLTETVGPRSGLLYNSIGKQSPSPNGSMAVFQGSGDGYGYRWGYGLCCNALYVASTVSWVWLMQVGTQVLAGGDVNIFHLCSLNNAPALSGMRHHRKQMVPWSRGYHSSALGSTRSISLSLLHPRVYSNPSD